MKPLQKAGQSFGVGDPLALSGKKTKKAAAGLILTLAGVLGAVLPLTA